MDIWRLARPRSLAHDLMTLKSWGDEKIYIYCGAEDTHKHGKRTPSGVSAYKMNIVYTVIII